MSCVSLYAMVVKFLGWLLAIKTGGRYMFSAPTLHNRIPNSLDMAR